MIPQNLWDFMVNKVDFQMTIVRKVIMIRYWCRLQKLNGNTANMQHDSK